MGLAVLATVATSHSNTLLGEGRLEVQALRDGYSLAFVCAAGFVFVAWLVTFCVLRDAKQPTADQLVAEPVAGAAPEAAPTADHL